MAPDFAKRWPRPGPGGPNSVKNCQIYRNPWPQSEYKHPRIMGLIVATLRVLVLFVPVLPTVVQVVPWRRERLTGSPLMSLLHIPGTWFGRFMDCDCWRKPPTPRVKPRFGRLVKMLRRRRRFVILA